MLFIDPRTSPDPAYANFWNQVHSVSSILDGHKLALWFAERPPGFDLRKAARSVAVDGGEQIRVALGWVPKAGKTNSASVALHDFLQRSEELLRLRPTVVLARLELGDTIFRLLEEFLEYRPRLKGQMAGWWVDRPDVGDLSRFQEARPSGALLPESGRRGPMLCLDLVEIDDYWVVLTDHGAWSYSHSSTLLDGNKAWFLEQSESTPRVWEVALTERISRSSVAERFGADAAVRTRDDAARALVLSLSLHDPAAK